jgi:hypothetical protein
MERFWPADQYVTAANIQPSLAIDNANYGHISGGQGWRPNMMLPPEWTGYFQTYAGKLSVDNPAGVQWTFGPSGVCYFDLPGPEAAVSSCLNPSGNQDTVHTVYYNPGDGEIYYQLKVGDVTAWPENLSLTPRNSASGRASIEPFIDAYGDWVRVVWSEEQTDGSGNYDICYREMNLPLLNEGIGEWSPVQYISNTAGDSRYPTIAGNHVIWQDNTAGYWGIYIDGIGNLVSPAGTDCQYAHTNFQQYDANLQFVYFLWTRKVDATTYSVESAPMPFFASLAWASVDAGGIEPSPYNVYRDGYKVYYSDPVPVDYAYDELVYKFGGMKLPYRYELQVIGYHEEPTRSNQWNAQVKVDGEIARVLKLKTGIPDTAKIDIPVDYYQNDGTIEVRVKRLTGDFVSVNKVLLYQYEPEEETAKSGGAQFAEGTGNIGQRAEFKLNQNAPNPFKQQTAISYQLPQAGQVNLKIYNIAGQVVKTIVSGQQNAGAHSVTWDGKDENGKQAAAGVYVYTLNAGQCNATNRMILLR